MTKIVIKIYKIIVTKIPWGITRTVHIVHLLIGNLTGQNLVKSPETSVNRVKAPSVPHNSKGDNCVTGFIQTCNAGTRSLPSDTTLVPVWSHTAITHGVLWQTDQVLWLKQGTVQGQTLDFVWLWFLGVSNCVIDWLLRSSFLTMSNEFVKIWVIRTGNGRGGGGGGGGQPNWGLSSISSYVSETQLRRTLNFSCLVRFRIFSYYNSVFSIYLVTSSALFNAHYGCSLFIRRIILLWQKNRVSLECFFILSIQ